MAQPEQKRSEALFKFRRFAEFFLIFLPSVAVGQNSEALSCSSRPASFPCWLSASPPRITNNSESTYWSHVRPYDLRIFYLSKSNPATGSVEVSAKIRWRCPPEMAYPGVLRGFQIDISDTLSEREIHRYYANLAEGIAGATNNSLRTELFLYIDGLLKFGHNYSISVTLLPSAGGGTSETFFVLPRWIGANKPNMCAAPLSPEQIAIGTTWISSFKEIEVSPARQSVLVSFMPAPYGLCIHQYKIKLEDVEGTLLESAIVYQSENEDTIFYRFEGIPSGRDLIIKVTPNSTVAGKQCVCRNCNCVTLTSAPFSLELLRMEVGSRDPIHLTPRTATDMMYIWIMILLVTLLLTVMFCILLMIFYCRKLSNRQVVHLHSVDGIHIEEKLLLPKSSEGVPRTILLIDNCYQKWAAQMSHELAHALKRSGVIVRFDQWESHSVEENIHQWVTSVLMSVDYILLLNSGEDLPQPCTVLHSQAVSDEILSVVKPNHPRMLHISWDCCQKLAPFYLERLFSLPRDAEILCKQINTDYQPFIWKKLETSYHKRMHCLAPQRILPRITEDLKVSEFENEQEYAKSQTKEILTETVDEPEEVNPSQTFEENFVSNEMKTQPSRELRVCDIDSAYGSINSGVIGKPIST